MKNKIKGMFLTVLMLFGALYPSGQAYANGLPPKVITYLEKQNIAQSLINDENFKTVFTELYAISKRINLDQLKKSSFDIATLAKVQESNTQTDVMIVDKSKLATFLGYNSVLEFEIASTKIDNKIKALLTDHKDLKNLKPNEIQEIFKNLLSIKIYKFNTKQSSDPGDLAVAIDALYTYLFSLGCFGGVYVGLTGLQAVAYLIISIDYYIRVQSGLITAPTLPTTATGKEKEFANCALAASAAITEMKLLGVSFPGQADQMKLFFITSLVAFVAALTSKTVGIVNVFNFTKDNINWLTNFIPWYRANKPNITEIIDTKEL